MSSKLGADTRRGEWVVHAVVVGGARADRRDQECDNYGSAFP